MSERIEESGCPRRRDLAIMSLSDPDASSSRKRKRPSHSSSHAPAAAGAGATMAQAKKLPKSRSRDTRHLKRQALEAELKGLRESIAAMVRFLCFVVATFGSLS